MHNNNNNNNKWKKIKTTELIVRAQITMSWLKPRVKVIALSWICAGAGKKPIQSSLYTANYFRCNITE